MTYLKKYSAEKIMFSCTICDFNCSNKYNFNKHLQTKKHEILTLTNANLEKNAKKMHICLCGQEYKHKQSLYNHKKKCIYNTNFSDYNISTMKEMIYDCV